MIALSAVASGTYIVAVSGGVDSVVLFDLLRRQPNVRLVVAHFDHGMRVESQQDREFVSKLATSHNILFEHETARLGPRASEATARQARYNFLQKVCKKHHAAAIIMAHHGDDVLETAVINLMRGTGRRGLDSLRSHPALLRPLLHVSKADILAYARARQLEWREDRTNTDTSYLRNHIRHTVIPRLDAEQRRSFAQLIVRQSQLNQQIDSMLAELAKNTVRTSPSFSLVRHHIIMLPCPVAYELLQFASKSATGHTLERPLAYRALLFCRAGRLHKIFALGTQWQLRIASGQVIVEARKAC